LISWIRLFEQPSVKRTDIVEFFGVSNPTAGNIIDTFCPMGILVDFDPERRRNKMYAFREYIEILDKGKEL